ncbi:MAG: hypothetical protein ACREOU_04450 [Candidatus Eiseniibacteriota bacterium]
MSLPSNRSIPFAAVAALVTVVCLAGCGGDDDSPAPPMGTPDATIRIVSGATNQGNMAFNPPSTTVQINDVVRMTNGDGVTHTIQTVTAGGPSWGSISGGGSVDRTATTAGTFTFQCVISGHVMTGTLIVQP